MLLKKNQRVVVLLSEVELHAIEDIRTARKLPSRGATIRHLLAMGVATHEDRMRQAESNRSRSAWQAPHKP